MLSVMDLCCYFSVHIFSLHVAWYVHINALLKILLNNSEGCVIPYIHHAYASASPISAHKCMSNLVSDTLSGRENGKVALRQINNIVSH